MLRIGLISDDLTFQEVQQSLDPTECELMRSFEPNAVDSILVLSAPRSTEKVLANLVDNHDMTHSTAPLIGTIGPSSLTKQFDGRIVSASNLDGFLKLSRMTKRRKTVLEESELRKNTIAEFTKVQLPGALAKKKPKRVVFLGEPSGFYLKLNRELKDQGLDVVAALSERTAYDSLVSSETAAFILSLPPSLYPMELLDHIHGRSDLKTMPVILVGEEHWDVESIADYVAAFVRKSDSVTNCAKHLIRFFDDQSHLTEVLNVANHPSIRDPATGAFNGSFAKRYLPRQLERALTRSNSFEMALITPIYLDKDTNLDPKDLARFYARFSAIIRSEDFLAHVSWNQFVLSLPGMSEGQTRQTLDRTRRVLDATVDGMNGSQISFTYQIKSFTQLSALKALFESLGYQSNVA